MTSFGSQLRVLAGPAQRVEEAHLRVLKNARLPEAAAQDAIVKKLHSHINASGASEGDKNMLHTLLSDPTNRQNNRNVYQRLKAEDASTHNLYAAQINDPDNPGYEPTLASATIMSAADQIHIHPVSMMLGGAALAEMAHFEMLKGNTNPLKKSFESNKILQHARYFYQKQLQWYQNNENIKSGKNPGVSVGTPNGNPTQPNVQGGAGAAGAAAGAGAGGVGGGAGGGGGGGYPGLSGGTSLVSSSNSSSNGGGSHSGSAVSLGSVRGHILSQSRLGHGSSSSSTLTSPRTFSISNPQIVSPQRQGFGGGDNPNAHLLSFDNIPLEHMTTLPGFDTEERKKELIDIARKFQRQQQRFEQRSNALESHADEYHAKVHNINQKYLARAFKQADEETKRQFLTAAQDFHAARSVSQAEQLQPEHLIRDYDSDDSLDEQANTQVRMEILKFQAALAQANDPTLFPKVYPQLVDNVNRIYHNFADEKQARQEHKQVLDNLNRIHQNFADENQTRQQHEHQSEVQEVSSALVLKPRPRPVFKEDRDKLLSAKLAPLRDPANESLPTEQRIAIIKDAMTTSGLETSPSKVLPISDGVLQVNPSITNSATAIRLRRNIVAPPAKPRRVISHDNLDEARRNLFSDDESTAVLPALDSQIASGTDQDKKAIASIAKHIPSLTPLISSQDSFNSGVPNHVDLHDFPTSTPTIQAPIRSIEPAVPLPSDQAVSTPTTNAATVSRQFSFQPEKSLVSSSAVPSPAILPSPAVTRAARKALNVPETYEALNTQLRQLEALPKHLDGSGTKQMEQVLAGAQMFFDENDNEAFESKHEHTIKHYQEYYRVDKGDAAYQSRFKVYDALGYLHTRESQAKAEEMRAKNVRDFATEFLKQNVDKDPQFFVNEHQHAGQLLKEQGDAHDQFQKFGAIRQFAHLKRLQIASDIHNNYEELLEKDQQVSGSDLSPLFEGVEPSTHINTTLPDLATYKIPLRRSPDEATKHLEQLLFESSKAKSGNSPFSDYNPSTPFPLEWDSNIFAENLPPATSISTAHQSAPTDQTAQQHAVLSHSSPNQQSPLAQNNFDDGGFGFLDDANIAELEHQNELAAQEAEKKQAEISATRSRIISGNVAARVTPQSSPASSRKASTVKASPISQRKQPLTFTSPKASIISGAEGIPKLSETVAIPTVPPTNAAKPVPTPDFPDPDFPLATAAGIAAAERADRLRDLELARLERIAARNELARLEREDAQQKAASVAVAPPPVASSVPTDSTVPAKFATAPANEDGVKELRKRAQQKAVIISDDDEDGEASDEQVVEPVSERRKVILASLREGEKRRFLRKREDDLIRSGKTDSHILNLTKVKSQSLTRADLNVLLDAGAQVGTEPPYLKTYHGKAGPPAHQKKVAAYRAQQDFNLAFKATHTGDLPALYQKYEEHFPVLKSALAAIKKTPFDAHTADLSSKSIEEIHNTLNPGILGEEQLVQQLDQAKEAEHDARFLSDAAKARFAANSKKLNSTLVHYRALSIKKTNPELFRPLTITEKSATPQNVRNMLRDIDPASIEENYDAILQYHLYKQHDPLVDANAQRLHNVAATILQKQVFPILHQSTFYDPLDE